MAPTPQHLRSGGEPNPRISNMSKNAIFARAHMALNAKKGRIALYLDPRFSQCDTQPPPTLLAGTIDELDIKKKYI